VCENAGWPYRARARGSRSRRSSLRSGKPATWRRAAGGLLCKDQATRDASIPKPNGAHTHWRAGCVERMHGRFGKGRMEKDQHWHLASRLLHVVLAYSQLRLARRTIQDVHLPWEAAQRPDRQTLTPARVRQAFSQLLVTLKTPANAPKPCGRSPGRPKGARSGAAPRFPALKKAA
jgi:hypothetical protein